MAWIDTLSRNSRLHYWEQRAIGIGFYRQVKKLLKKEGAFLAGRTVLDIGCGQGILSEGFPDNGYYGIDTDFDSLRFARRRIFHGTFICQDATGLSFRNETFDIVISIGILHHLNDDQFKNHFAEAFRVLRRGGKVIVCDTFMPAERDCLRKWMAGLERGNYLRPPEELERRLLECGLSGFKLNRFRTWYSQNYSLVLKKP